MPPPGAPLSQGRPPRRPPRRPPSRSSGDGCCLEEAGGQELHLRRRRRRSAPSTASTDEDQRHPPPAPPHLKPITKISARNLKSDEWSAVAIRPEHGQGASAADTGFVEHVFFVFSRLPRAIVHAYCVERPSGTSRAISVPRA